MIESERNRPVLNPPSNSVLAIQTYKNTDKDEGEKFVLLFAFSPYLKDGKDRIDTMPKTISFVIEVSRHEHSAFRITTTRNIGQMESLMNWEIQTL